IRFLGWMSPTQLSNYLMASDLYVQLGSQSATMQHALCNGNVVALFPYESHTYLLGDSCYYISNVDDLKNLLFKLSMKELNIKRIQSRKLAEEVLDYKKIANIILR